MRAGCGAALLRDKSAERSPACLPAGAAARGSQTLRSRNGNECLHVKTTTAILTSSVPGPRAGGGDSWGAAEASGMEAGARGRSPAGPGGPGRGTGAGMGIGGGSAGRGMRCPVPEGRGGGSPMAGSGVGAGVRWFPSL